jgi:hypothetical protein
MSNDFIELERLLPFERGWKAGLAHYGHDTILYIKIVLFNGFALGVFYLALSFPELFAITVSVTGGIILSVWSLPVSLSIFKHRRLPMTRTQKRLAEMQAGIVEMEARIIEARQQFAAAYSKLSQSVPLLHQIVETQERMLGQRAIQAQDTLPERLAAFHDKARLEMQAMIAESEKRTVQIQQELFAEAEVHTANIKQELTAIQARVNEMAENQEKILALQERAVQTQNRMAETIALLSGKTRLEQSEKKPAASAESSRTRQSKVAGVRRHTSLPLFDREIEPSTPEDPEKS